MTPAPERPDMETCPTCWQPVPRPHRGDHDYGIPLSVHVTDAGLREVLGKLIEHHETERVRGGTHLRSDRCDVVGEAIAALAAAPVTDAGLVAAPGRWAFLDTETGDWIEVKPGVVHVSWQAEKETA